jgi:Na+/proline symporter
MDTSTTIIIVASVLFLIASIINGIWKRSSKNLIDYVATPNKFSTFPLVVSMIGTIVGGGIVIGMTSMGAKGGVIGIVLAL